MAMKINMEFAINPGTEATIGHILVAHSTDDINATARNLAQYENRVWDEKPYTYVHFGVDDIGVWQVAVPGHRANGAGNVNRYAPVQIELCEFRDKTRSLNAYKNFVVLIQELAPKYGIPLTLDDSNRTAGIKSHAWCSQNYGGSDHQDPYPWLTSIGISKAQFLADVKGKAVAPSAPAAKPSKSVAQVANEVINGSWGSGNERNRRLMDAGYNAAAIQAEVNRILAGVSSPKPSLKTTAQVAKEVIDGKWSSGQDRVNKLNAAGYNASAVQAEVNRQLGATSPKPSTKPYATIVQEVINGSWGSGQDRINRLTKAGYNASSIQARVNAKLGASKPSKSIAQVAAEVINGSWGNGADRANRLTKAGYNASAVQAEVNRQLR